MVAGWKLYFLSVLVLLPLRWPMRSLEMPAAVLNRAFVLKLLKFVGFPNFYFVVFLANVQSVTSQPCILPAAEASFSCFLSQRTSCLPPVPSLSNRLNLKARFILLIVVPPFLNLCLCKDHTRLLSTLSYPVTHWVNHAYSAHLNCVLTRHRFRSWFTVLDHLTLSHRVDWPFHFHYIARCTSTLRTG